MSLYVMVTADFPDVDSSKRAKMYECLKEKNWEKISEVGRDISTVWHTSFKEDVSYTEAINISKNQTSYKVTQSNRGTPIRTLPALPRYYKNGKPCLSYSIQIIYDHTTFEIIAILLISIPNGQLFTAYGNKIATSGKSKDESFRYKYSSNPYFALLSHKPFRVKFIYFDPNSGFSKKDITTSSMIQ